MPDPTAKMFEARVGVEDKASKAIESITEKMQEATKGAEDFTDEVKGLTDGLDKAREKVNEIQDDTNELGLAGAAMVGTKGKGSIKEQFKTMQSSLIDFYKFVGDKVIDTTLSLASATASLAGALSKVYSIISGEAAFAKLSGMLAGGVVEAVSLVGVIEELRHEMQLTNQEAAALGPAISNTMLQTSGNIELAVAALDALGQEAQLATPQTEQLAAASVYMAEAWRMNVGHLTRFNVQLARLYEIGPTNLKGVASAMDQVARTTRISREELVTLVQTFEEGLIYRIPQEFRGKVMPQMLADISAIAGAMKDMYIDPTEVLSSFNQAMDIYNDQGQKMKAMIVGLGGATQAELMKMLDPSDPDAGGFYVAQVTAIEKLKASMGDRAFLQNVQFYAEQMGISREALVGMVEEGSKAAKKRIDDARKELKSTESLRSAWDRALGVFNEIWVRLENIGRAILIGIGEPLLKVIVPMMDKVGKALQWIIEIFQGFGEGEKKLVGIAALLGTIAQAFQMGFHLIFTKVLPWIIGTALPAIAGMLGGPVLTGILAVVAGALAVAEAFVVIGVAIAAIIDWGGTLLDVVSPIFDKIWGLVKAIVMFGIAMNPITAILAGLVMHWDTFYDAIKPGLKEISDSWTEMRLNFYELGQTFLKAFGMGEDGADDFMTMMSEVIRKVVKGFGKGLRPRKQITL